MKALVLNGPGHPFSLETIPDPIPESGEAVVKVITCGAGLTIQHVKAGRAKVDYPRIIGHEITGIIEAVGEDVSNVLIGDPVTAYFYLTCGNCKWCRLDREMLCENFGGYIGRACDGGYAEFMKLPAHNFLKLPEELAWKSYPAEAGVITDAIATPLKVVRHANIQAGETVAVFGAGGGLGIHMLMLAKWAHASVIAVDIAGEKFDACRRAGADECINPREGHALEALKDLSRGGIDVAIDFVSSQETLETAVQCLGRGGRMVTLGGSGVSFSAHAPTMLEKELVLMGCRYATRKEVIKALDLCARGDFWPLVTETTNMAGAEALHERIEQGLITGRAAILMNDI
ncbi:MAG: zinc-binding dehydrogenase [Pseudomonadota bacterium]|nr:zinc-binding dehydrogenase [Pseudomonadota bacterium]